MCNRGNILTSPNGNSTDSPPKVRAKDPLHNLRAPARAAPPASRRSRAQTQVARREWRTDRVLGEMVKGLQDLSGCRGQGAGCPQTRADRAELERLRSLAGTFVQRQGASFGANAR